jgi:hypothetical protein
MGMVSAGKTGTNGKTLPERTHDPAPAGQRAAWTSGVAACNLKDARAKSFAKT